MELTVHRSKLKMYFGFCYSDILQSDLRPAINPN